jgi:hypothetical protein
VVNFYTYLDTRVNIIMGQREYSGTVPGYKYSEYSEYLHYLSQYTSYAKVKMLFFDVGCNSHYIYPRVVLRILFALLDLYTDNR